MSRITIKPASRTEWLEIRKQGIGSSEIATIVGLNPNETPYQLWRRKTGLDPAKEETFAMRAGHYLEDAVAHFWQDSTGREVIKSSAGDWLIKDADKPFFASPDRTYRLPGEKRNAENKGILECKTTQKVIDPDDLPKSWFCQVQWQLGVSGLRHGSLAWLCSGRAFGYKDIDFVPDFYGWLAEEAEKFWADYVVTGKEPPLTNPDDLIAKYPTPTAGKEIDTTDDTLGHVTEIKRLKEEIKSLENTLTEHENAVKMTFSDAEALTYQGQTLATWKATTSEKLDAKALKAEHPDIYEKFVSTRQYRRFIIK